MSSFRVSIIKCNGKGFYLATLIYPKVEEELSESGNRQYLFDECGSREVYMNKVDAKRANTVYPHTQCSEECKKKRYALQRFFYSCIVFPKGFGKLWSIDGNWKLRYLICMFPVSKPLLTLTKKLSYAPTHQFMGWLSVKIYEGTCKAFHGQLDWRNICISKRRTPCHPCPLIVH